MNPAGCPDRVVAASVSVVVPGDATGLSNLSAVLTVMLAAGISASPIFVVILKVFVEGLSVIFETVIASFAIGPGTITTRPDVAFIVAPLLDVASVGFETVTEIFSAVVSLIESEVPEVLEVKVAGVIVVVDAVPLVVTTSGNPAVAAVAVTEKTEPAVTFATDGVVIVTVPFPSYRGIVGNVVVPPLESVALTDKV